MSLETPEKVRTLQDKLYVKAKTEPNFRFYLLYDKVYRRDVLDHAYAISREKGGAPGVDRETFRKIEKRGKEEWIERLQEELRNQTYTPSPVRRVMIPKPNGGERPLGIPTIRDRVAQTAAKLVLEPIFEADFLDEAHGYRPGRSTHGAVQKVHRSLCEGYTDVVDADLSKYFDTIPHQELMRCVARRVVDAQMLKLIRAWLKVPVEERDEKGNRRLSGGKKSTTGTPQGGVISPLLANIYMHRYLKAWRQQGKGEQFKARVVNYADDFVIVSRGCATKALEWTRKVMQAIGLTLNETKTCIRNARKETFNFLGYTFGPERFRKTGRWYLAAKPAEKVVTRLKGKVKELLRPSNQWPWEDVRKRLNQILEGWADQFSYGTIWMAYRAIDNYVYDCVRGFLRRRHKVSTRGTRRFSGEAVWTDFGVVKLGRLPRRAPT